MLMAALVVLACSGLVEAGAGVARVPVPRPRPAEAPAVPQPPVAAGKSGDAEQPAAAGPSAEKSAVADRPTVPPPSACRLALDDSIAIAPSIPAIHGPGACGGDDLVRLEAIVLPDKGHVPLQPAATMRCTMANAVADWLRTDIVPIAAGLGTRISELDNFDSFDCRGRNRIVGAKLSEHGRANALDVRAIKLASGQSIALTDRETPRELREKVLLSVCTRFSTVLGPGSDGYHEDHVHLDLAERRNNYKICQWNVWDPLPKIAPLMPEERPAEAPPREVAEDKGMSKLAEPAAAEAPAEPQPEPEAAPPQEPTKPKAMSKAKKRRAPASPFSFLR